MVLGNLFFLAMPNPNLPNLYSDRFTPAMYTQSYIDIVAPIAGCGPNALSTLTHECPLNIKDECRAMDPKQSRGTRDEIMLKFLEKRDIKAYRISPKDIAGSYGNADRNILEAHVLLVSQTLSDSFDSWFVYWNTHQFHNLVMGTFTVYEFLNRPPINMYVLHSPKWDVRSEHKRRAPSQQRDLISDRDQNSVVSLDFSLQRVDLIQQQLNAVEAHPTGVSKRQLIALAQARDGLKNAFRQLEELRLATRDHEWGVS